MKILRLEPDDNFVLVQLDDNQTHTIKIGVNFPSSLEERLVKHLKSNVNFLDVSPKEMSGIDPNIAATS